MRLILFLLLATVLVAACIGQTATAPKSDVGTSDVEDIGNEISGFGEDIEDLSVPDVDLTVP